MSNLAHSRGDIMRRLHELEKQVAALTTSKPMEAASISQGATTIRGSGAIRSETGAWELRSDRLLVNDPTIEPSSVAGLRHTEVNGTSGFQEGAEGARDVVLVGPDWATTVTIVALGVVSAPDDALRAWVAIDGDESWFFRGQSSANAQHHLTLPARTRITCRLRWQAPTAEEVRTALTVIGTYWAEPDDEEAE